MDSFNFRNSQNKSQKPQTKTTYTKTINSQFTPTAVAHKLILPAFLCMMAGFFIAGIIHTGNAHNNQELGSFSDDNTQTLPSDTKVEATTASNVYSSDPSTKNNEQAIEVGSNRIVKDSTSNSVSVRSSVTVSSSSSNSVSSDDVKPLVTVNGEEKELSRTGRYKESCKSKNSDTNIRIRIDNNSTNGGSSVNINNDGDCMN